MSKDQSSNFLFHIPVNDPPTLVLRLFVVLYHQQQPSVEQNFKPLLITQKITILALLVLDGRHIQLPFTQLSVYMIIKWMLLSKNTS